MASPQKEDGHIDIANEIGEKFCQYRISGEEWLVLWVILRKTYGWHKKEDKISLSQFAVMTGLKRQTACRAINKLSSKKIIAVIKNDDSGISKYRFNKDFDKWQPLSKKITVSSKKIRGVIKKDNQVSSFLRHTKETITKENIQKKTTLSAKQTDARIKQFFDFWHLTYKNRFKDKYNFSGGKEGKLIKELLDKYSYERLIEFGEQFFNSGDKFIFESGYTIGVFYSQINKLIANKNKPKGLTQAQLSNLKQIQEFGND